MVRKVYNSTLAHHLLSRAQMMLWSDHVREAVFAKTDGHCAYCVASLSWEQFGCSERQPGAWDVDRWTPQTRAKEAVDGLPNLVPACCACIAEKGEMTGEEYIARRRRQAGLT